MTNDNAQLLSLIPLLPLFGAAVAILTARLPASYQQVSGWIATGFAFVSFTICATLFLRLGTAPVEYSGWEWITVGADAEAPALNVLFGLRLDRLASVMSLIVTGVGSLIHLYAIGYMAEDPHRPRFFAYFNLFLFAMLLLVLGSNLLVMFVGWEGVGLCSFLLIGFWYREMDNARAGQKAFVVNRIGDAGFLLGIFTLFAAAGTLDFLALEGATPGFTPFVIELACLLLFIGAVGKSAQIPLYIWLPDAMAGPTPVSALIHAATMVTAGVYMIARMSFLYALAPTVLTIVCVIGALTAFLAATIALVQTDIKRVLAYSTVSQLGFMFMALGAGAFSNGIFHVVTHAFFKAALFMAAGSVIVGCHHEQDMRNFGGLWRTMPCTFATYLVATLAIAGVPYLSGFYSKDAIMWAVYSARGPLAAPIIGGLSGAYLLWLVGMVTAFLTAFYMTRSLVLTFFGKYRGHHPPHESRLEILIPLAVLLVLSALFGVLFGESFLTYLGVWTRSDLRGGHHALVHLPGYEQVELTATIVALSGIALAAVLYLFFGGAVRRIATGVPAFYRLLVNKWWVDELYGAAIVRPLRFTAELLYRVVDVVFIDGLVNGAALGVDTGGAALRRAHTGRITHYVLVMLIGTLLIAGYWVLT